MNSIANEINRLMPDNFLDRLTQLQSEIERHPAVVRLREQYPDCQIDQNQLFHYSRSVDACASCPGLENCPQQMAGHYLTPQADNGRVTFTYTPCQLQTAHDKQRKIQKLIKSHYVPDHILQMTFDKLDRDADRKEAIAETMRFCLGFKRGETKRGLYLHGSLGVGKSAIVGAAAHELATRNVDVLMVYVPDFLGEIKNAIKTGEVESKLDALREVSVLILDDIGAEPLTIWTRDEVLGPVLQRRMERFPTLFTSNLTTAELRQHLEKTKDEQFPNPVKAARLMDRIEPFVKTVRVGGKNRRRQNAGEV